MTRTRSLFKPAVAVKNGLGSVGSELFWDHGSLQSRKSQTIKRGLYITICSKEAFKYLILQALDIDYAALDMASTLKCFLGGVED